MTTATLERIDAEQTPDYLATFSAEGVWRGNCRTDVSARDFAIPVSEPAELGGDDSAANPMELLLAGLEGCLAVVVETVAKEYDASLKHLKLASDGTLDVRGFLAQAKVRPYFQTVRTRIDIDIDLPQEKFDQFVSAVAQRCPAGTLFSAANVDFTIDWVRA